MSRRRCCCESVPCPDTNCLSVRSQCATLGLLPFTIKITGVFQPVQCQDTRYSEIACNLECPPDTMLCGGCTPCDPTGSLPGANGRTCPCKTEDCDVPTDRAIPDISCKSGIVASYCDIPHNDFWYMTSCRSIDECEARPSDCCDWVGVTDCAFTLVRVPAGRTRIAPGPLSGTWSGVPQFNDCAGNPVPYPITMAGGTMYGWPFDCSTVPQPCPCACTCTGGWDPVVLQDTATEPFDCSTNPKILYAQIVWAIPCGGPPEPGSGTDLLCGDGCDDCAASYIAVNFYGTTYQYDPYVMTNGWYEGITCDDLPCDGSGMTCTPYCCEKSYNLTVIFKRNRDQASMAGANKCQMAKGEYVPVGIGPCGPYGPSYDECDGDVCVDYVAQCSTPGVMNKLLEQLGAYGVAVEVL